MLRSESDDFLAIKEHFELLFPQLRVVARLLNLRELTLVVGELDGFDVVLEHDLELLQHAFSGFFGWFVRQIAVAGLDCADGSVSRR